MSSATTSPTFKPVLLALGLSLVSLFLLGIIGGFVIWVDDPSLSLLSAVRGGVVVVLAVHGGGLVVDSISLSFVPLGAPMLAVWLLWWSIRRSGVAPTRVSVPLLIGGYTVSVGLLAFAMGSNQPLRAIVGSGLVSAIAVALAFRSSWVLAIDQRYALVLRAVVRGGALLLALATTVVLASLLAHRDVFADMWSANNPNALGAVFLLLLTLAMLPNLVLWSIGLMLGPGFALGAQTGVDLAGSQLLAIPAVPIFAAVPAAGGFGSAVFILALIPIVSGGYIGWTVAQSQTLSAMHAFAQGLGAAAILGLVIGCAAAISGGSIGPGLMQVTGPEPWLVIIFAVANISAGGGLGGLFAHYRGSRAFGT